MHVEIFDTLADITAEDWDRLNQEHNPFLQHAFLHALESSGCCTAKSGWQPQHLALYAPHNRSRQLIGAVPLYLKTHSYGEYVFDWAWANAYANAGLDYYPKLVAAVPFSPVTGARLLLAPDIDTDMACDTLVQAALQLAQTHQASSLHWLFLPAEQLPCLQQHGHLQRMGYQFHWQNQGYADFDAFLAEFSAQKRKKVKRERRYVQDAGIRMQVVQGDALQQRHWDQFYAFYHSTIRNHGAIPYLNKAFFDTLGHTMADNIVLILAHKDDETVAGALNLRNHDTLYGRYWGCLQDYHSLHFETCYYRAIEYCIDNGLQRFEAGAQGEHKLSRGFLPTATYSAHWLSHAQFSQAVADFLRRETHGVEFYLDELSEHSPFRQINSATLCKE